jgi:carbon storage regulator
MLVLSRKIGERIHIGEDITVEVRRVAGNRVTLSFDAPKHIRILRGELKAASEAFQEPDALETLAIESSHEYAVSHHRISPVDSFGYSI